MSRRSAIGDTEVIEDDELFSAEIGDWGRDKYGLLRSYCGIFASAMKKKWAARVYVDLFSGSGRARLKTTGRTVLASPMIALAVRDPFDHYVFCDMDPICIQALSLRVSRDFPSADVEYVSGDCNERVDDLLAAIPKGDNRGGVLTLCMVDPFAIANLRFETIRRLAERPVDFLVLVPSHMDANRNRARLLAKDQTSLDRFLGSRAWREDWRRATSEGTSRSFGTFVLDQFGRSMRSLGYLYDEPGTEVEVRHGGRVLYYLAFYSRHPLGGEFWTKATRAAKGQLPLF